MAAGSTKPHAVIFCLPGDPRRFAHMLALGDGWTHGDVLAAVAASHGSDPESVRILVVSPVVTRSPVLPDVAPVAPVVTGPTALPKRETVRRKLISTDTHPDDWPPDVDYLQRMIALLQDRRARARRRGDGQLEGRMSHRLTLARAKRDELLISAALRRSG